MQRLRLSAFTAIAIATLACGPAHADTVLSSSLANPNYTAGLVTVTTTTNAGGRRTTVTGPSGGASRYEDTNPPKGVWQQQNVGAGGSVGITTDHARNGDGSLSFSGVDAGSKADAEIRFTNSIALSSLTTASYEAFRDVGSTAPAHLINSLRFIIGDSNSVSLNSYLIFEPVYNTNPVANPVAEGAWLPFTIDANTILFSNNANLSEPAGTNPCPGCYATLGDWQASNPTLTILGLSTGNGSGWSGTYSGAVDNISFTAGGATTSYNFEVNAPAVPEPATWALMIGGVGVIGGAMRRRNRLALRLA